MKLLILYSVLAASTALPSDILLLNIQPEALARLTRQVEDDGQYHPDPNEDDGSYHPDYDGSYGNDHLGDYHGEKEELSKYKHEEVPYKHVKIDAIPYKHLSDDGTYIGDYQYKHNENYDNGQYHPANDQKSQVFGYKSNIDVGSLLDRSFSHSSQKQPKPVVSSSGFYISGKQSNENDGQYHHDNSGEYNTANKQNGKVSGQSILKVSGQVGQGLYSSSSSRSAQETNGQINQISGQSTLSGKVEQKVYGSLSHGSVQETNKNNGQYHHDNSEDYKKSVVSNDVVARSSVGESQVNVGSVSKTRSSVIVDQPLTKPANSVNSQYKTVNEGKSNVSGQSTLLVSGQVGQLLDSPSSYSSVKEINNDDGQYHHDNSGNYKNSVVSNDDVARLSAGQPQVNVGPISQSRSNGIVDQSFTKPANSVNSKYKTVNKHNSNVSEQSTLQVSGQVGQQLHSSSSSGSVQETNKQTGQVSVKVDSSSSSRSVQEINKDNGQYHHDNSEYYKKSVVSNNDVARSSAGQTRNNGIVDQSFTKPTNSVNSKYKTVNEHNSHVSGQSTLQVSGQVGQQLHSSSSSRSVHETNKHTGQVSEQNTLPVSVKVDSSSSSRSVQEINKDNGKYHHDNSGDYEKSVVSNTDVARSSAAQSQVNVESVSQTKNNGIVEQSFTKPANLANSQYKTVNEHNSHVSGQSTLQVSGQVGHQLHSSSSHGSVQATNKNNGQYHHDNSEDHKKSVVSNHDAARSSAGQSQVNIGSVSQTRSIVDQSFTKPLDTINAHYKTVTKQTGQISGQSTPPVSGQVEQQLYSLSSYKSIQEPIKDHKLDTSGDYKKDVVTNHDVARLSVDQSKINVETKTQTGSIVDQSSKKTTNTGDKIVSEDIGTVSGQFSQKISSSSKSVQEDHQDDGQYRHDNSGSFSHNESISNTHDAKTISQEVVQSVGQSSSNFGIASQVSKDFTQGVVDVASKKSLSKKTVITSYKSVGQSNENDGQYHHDTSGNNKIDNAAAHNAQHPSYSSSPFFAQSSGITNTNSKPVVQNNPVITSYKSVVQSNKNNGQYHHDTSGEYKTDNSAGHIVQHSSDSSLSIFAQSSGVTNTNSKPVVQKNPVITSYKSVVQSNENDGQYHHDTSGDNKNDNSDTLKSQHTSHSSSSIFAQSSEVTNTNSRPVVQKNPVITSYNSVVQSKENDEQYHHDTSGDYKTDNSAEHNVQHPSYSSSSIFAQSSGITNTNSKPVVQKNPVITIDKFVVQSNENDGKYHHDTSGDYKNDNSVANIAKHSTSSIFAQSSGITNTNSKPVVQKNPVITSYKSVVQSNENDGQYHHDTSGDYKNDNSASNIAQHSTHSTSSVFAQSSGIPNTNSKTVVQKYPVITSYKSVVQSNENDGQYYHDSSGDYKTDNSAGHNVLHSSHSSSSIFAQSSGVTNTNSKPIVQKNPVITSYKSVVQSNENDGQYHHVTSGDYKNDNSASNISQHSTHSASSIFAQSSGIPNTNSKPLVQNNPVITSYKSVVQSNENDGQYHHDTSGDYKTDYSAGHNGQHSSSSIFAQSSGVTNKNSKPVVQKNPVITSYKSVVQSNENDGQYHHDTSGDNKNDNSDTLKSQHTSHSSSLIFAQSSEVSNTNSRPVVQKNPVITSYNSVVQSKENDGQYHQDTSGDYKTDNSAEHNVQHPSYSSSSIFSQSSGITNTNSKPVVQKNPVITIDKSVVQSNENDGKYPHDTSGDYKNDNSVANIAKHSTSSIFAQSSGITNTNSKPVVQKNPVITSYKSVVQSNENDGQYHHDTSGDYKNDNSASNIAQHSTHSTSSVFAQSSGIPNTNSKTVVQKYPVITSYKSVVQSNENDGQYHHDTSGDYKTDNSAGHNVLHSSHSSSSIFAQSSGVTNTNSKPIVQKNPVITSYKSVVQSNENDGQYHHVTSGDYKNDNSASNISQHSTHSASSIFAQSSGIPNTNSKPLVQNNPVITSYKSVVQSNENDGQYHHDTSGDYKTDYSAGHNGQHSSSSIFAQSSGVTNKNSKPVVQKNPVITSYKSVVQSNENDGQYHHDTSGDNKNDNSDTHKSQHPSHSSSSIFAQSSEVTNTNSRPVVQKNPVITSYKSVVQFKENDGQYNHNTSGDYKNDNHAENNAQYSSSSILTESSGITNTNARPVVQKKVVVTSYKSVVQSNENDEQYHHVTSGDYKTDNFAGHNAQHPSHSSSSVFAQSSGITNTNSIPVQNNLVMTSYKSVVQSKENDGQYHHDTSGVYNANGSGQSSYFGIDSTNLRPTLESSSHPSLTFGQTSTQGMIKASVEGHGQEDDGQYYPDRNGDNNHDNSGEDKYSQQREQKYLGKTESPLSSGLTGSNKKVLKINYQQNTKDYKPATINTQSSHSDKQTEVHSKSSDKPTGHFKSEICAYRLGLNEFKNIHATVQSDVSTKHGQIGEFDKSHFGIVKKIEEFSDDGYHFIYDTKNGVIAEETGTLVGKDIHTAHMEVKGFHSYEGSDGAVYTVEYTANSDNGYVPKISNILKSESLVRLQ